MPLPGVRLQQPQHHGVVRVPVPAQREPHDPRQMQIPHRHRVRRPMTALHGLRGRPRPDAGHDLQPLLRRRRFHPGRLLQPRGDPHGPQDRRRPLVVHPGQVPLPGRDHRPRPRRRHDTHPSGCGPRRRFPVLPYEQPPRLVRLQRRDLLLQDRGDQRLHHQPGPGQPQPRPPVCRERQQPVPRYERGRVVVGAQHPRQPLQQPLRPRPPGLAPHLTAARGDPQRARPGGRPAGPPHRPVRHRPERRIARTAPQRTEHQPQLQRPARHPHPYPARRAGLPRHARGHGALPAAHRSARGPGSETSCHERGPWHEGMRGKGGAGTRGKRKPLRG